MSWQFTIKNVMWSSGVVIEIKKSSLRQENDYIYKAWEKTG